jgi:hypothetical protein
VLAIRQNGEAWDKPFVAIFEPSTYVNSSIQSVEQLMDGQKVVGAKVVSKVGDAVITDYIISQDEADASYFNKELNLKFEGRFGIVRTEKSQYKSTISLYIGDGKKLIFKDFEVKADEQRRAFNNIKQ